MLYAKIETEQAALTLEQLHAELVGKVPDHRKETNRLRKTMLHVETIVKPLQLATTCVRCRETP